MISFYSILDFEHCIYRKNRINTDIPTYRCRMVINNIVTEVFNFNIYAYYLSTNCHSRHIVTKVFNFNIYVRYLSTNCGTLVIYIAQTVYALHHCKYFAICSIDVVVDDFDRFDLFFFLRLTIWQSQILFSYVVTKVRICYSISVSA